MTRRQIVWLIVAITMSLGAPSLSAQTAINQVRLNAAVTSVDQGAITLTSAASVSVGDILYIDREALQAQAVNTTTNVVTAARGQLGTRASLHLTGAITWTGAANRFYFYSPSGRCTAPGAYPAGAKPWINLLTGEVFYCDDNVFGVNQPSSWRGLTLDPVDAGRLPYTPIAYRTSRTSAAGVVLPAYTAQLSDVLIASLTYSGPFEVFLPSPTGLLGKVITVSDFAGLADGSPSGRTIIIRGLGDSITSWPLGIVNATSSWYVGITATSQYYWKQGPKP